MFIQVYLWDDAPEFKHKGSHGGDEDFVIVVPKRLYEEDWQIQSATEKIVEELTVCGSTEFEEEMEGILYKVFVTSHA